MSSSGLHHSHESIIDRESYVPSPAPTHALPIHERSSSESTFVKPVVNRLDSDRIAVHSPRPAGSIMLRSLSLQRGFAGSSSGNAAAVRLHNLVKQSPAPKVLLGRGVEGESISMSEQLNQWREDASSALASPRPKVLFQRSSSSSSSSIVHTGIPNHQITQSSNQQISTLRSSSPLHSPLPAMQENNGSAGSIDHPSQNKAPQTPTLSVIQIANSTLAQVGPTEDTRLSAPLVIQQKPKTTPVHASSSNTLMKTMFKRKLGPADISKSSKLSSSSITSEYTESSKGSEVTIAITSPADKQRGIREGRILSPVRDAVAAEGSSSLGSLSPGSGYTSPVESMQHSSAEINSKEHRVEFGPSVELNSRQEQDSGYEDDTAEHSLQNLARFPPVFPSRNRPKTIRKSLPHLGKSNALLSSVKVTKPRKAEHVRERLSLKLPKKDSVRRSSSLSKISTQLSTTHRTSPSSGKKSKHKRTTIIREREVDLSEFEETPRKRARVPPLNFWSNERILNGKIVGGTTPDRPRWSDIVSYPRAKSSSSGGKKKFYSDD